MRLVKILLGFREGCGWEQGCWELGFLLLWFMARCQAAVGISNEECAACLRILIGMGVVLPCSLRSGHLQIWSEYGVLRLVAAMSSIWIPRLVSNEILDARLGVQLGVSSLVSHCDRQMVMPMKATVTSLPNCLDIGGVMDQVPSCFEIDWGGAPIHCCSM